MKVFCNHVALVATVFVLTCLGCKDPDFTQPGDGDSKVDEEEPCVGDNCSTGGDAEIVTDHDVPDAGDAGKDEKPNPDIVSPDETGQDCGQCEVGEIKCVAGQPKFYECLDEGGCRQWSKQKVACKGDHDYCVCEKAENLTCIPENGIACGCAPQCEEKECGNDECGGQCGDCKALHTETWACNPLTNQCEDMGQEECPCPGGKLCDEGNTYCNGLLVQHCANVLAGVEGCENEPCWQPGEAQDCPDNQYCSNDKCVCEFKTCGEEEDFDCCPEGDEWVCDVAGKCCVPNCTNKVCGDDGCGGSCGDCATSGCGDGSKPEVCNKFECTCVPDSECNEGEQTCTSDFSFKKCEPYTDFPEKFKWSPSFGCPEGEKCNKDTGACECQPDCKGKECGDDGCDGSCGECQGYYQCIAGKCACECDPEDAPVCDLKNGKQYPNECEALCDGATEYEQGECPKCEDNCTVEEKNTGVICGEDNQDYASFCELKCQIGSPQCTAPGKATCPEFKHAGPCKLSCCKEKGCPQDFVPVCGSDNKTYCNKCAALSCPEGANVQITCLGECVDKTACPTCNNDCVPVCGQLPNGFKRTFINECNMKCDGATKLWNGSCCEEAPDIDAPVCSTNFKVYKNAMFLDCQAEPGEALLYDIPQTADGAFWTDVCEKCQADLSAEEPVCGSDFLEYTNLDALLCAVEDNPKLSETPLCQDACGFDTCPCPPATSGFPVETEISDVDDGKRGVCGKDGNTYGNECSATYYNTTVIAYTWCLACSTECAKTAYAPMCCEDGVTYPNPCIPDKCNTFLDVSKCNKGKCCLAVEDCDDGNPATTDVCTVTGVCENL